MHQLLICADVLNLFGFNTNYTKKSTEALIGANKEADQEVNTVLKKSVLTSHNKMQGRFITEVCQTDLLDIWKSLNISERRCQIKFAFMNKLKLVRLGKCFLPFLSAYFVVFPTV